MPLSADDVMPLSQAVEKLPALTDQADQADGGQKKSSPSMALDDNHLTTIR
ncbi:MAG: hypothetical protein ORN29_03075 [Rhodoferax sp.]|nr:hypothetical protein [Rhodoferax sp.]